MSRRTRAPRGWACLALALALIACDDGASTELIVVVDTDLAIPGALDRVDIRVMSPGGRSVSASASFVGAEAVTLPVSLGVTPSGDGDTGAVRIEVTGLSADTVVVTGRVTTSFVEGERRLVPIFLEAACATVDCSSDEDTCRLGTCVSAAVAPETLPLFDGPPGRLDGGAPRDATPPDAMPADASPCPPGVPLSGGVCSDQLVVQVAIGSGFTCVRRRSGTVSCWGKNDVGQLGNGITSSEPQLTPTDVMGISDAIFITAGFDSACAIRESNEPLCWGANEAGQLGGGTTMYRSVPTPLVGVTSAEQVSVGFDHTCLRTSDGRVLCFGDNRNGGLGDGTTAQRGTPSELVGVPGGLGVAVSVSASQRYACAAYANGEALCWGANDSGQLGVGDLTQRTMPQLLVAFTMNSITAVATNAATSCALLDVGAVYCWGEADEGRLGDGGASMGVDQTSGVAVVDVSRVQQISGTSTGETMCARAEGEVFCWGGNYFGQLGAPGPSSDRPLLVSLPELAADIVAGSGSTCAVLATGRLHCWGNNSSGQLGDGTTEVRSGPQEAVVLF